jgi:arylsulfatase A-like enzyme
MNRREFIAAAGAPLLNAAGQRPNIVLIITDDQGFGDLSIHGNDKLKTPNMDRIGREGIRFTQFHVNPVCSPTRASLMTGRYYYRTGVVDTYLGRSMMHADEVTLAEMLAKAGYRTGLFGKWHLGDNYPMRPGDQGFQESVAIKGGGLGQPSDFPGGGAYTDPILLHNGKPKRFKGYCTDIYVDEALRFIERNRKNPFFVYLPTNAPHTPLEIDEKYVEPFRKAGLDEVTAKIYAMVTEADGQIGRVLKALDDWKLAENTIVIFMTDNGPQQKRWNAGMRGLKGTVYEGGIRVPFFLRWPGVVKPGTTVDRLAAHVDVLPTLLEACGTTAPRDVKLDGRSLLPLLKNAQAPWQDRTLFFQWHRGDAPELYRACAAHNQRWKLVNGKELYDLGADPEESRDVSAAHPDVVAKLRAEYEAWFKDVSSRGYAPPRIHIGTSHENPVLLTRQDWRGPRAGSDAKSLGYWEVFVARPAEYEFKVQFAPAPADGVVRVRLNGATLESKIASGATECVVGRARVPKAEGRLEAEVEAAGATVGVHYVTVSWPQ